jgi:phosphoglycerol transferase MdoB-like AlkP superfamily enzyme
MKKLKVPRYIQWIFFSGVVFLAIMSLLRWLLVFVFRTPSTKEVALGKAYLLGLRFDLRMVCIMALILFIIGSIPALHPLNKKWGRRLALWIWVGMITFFCLFYAIDFGYYAYLHQRINASVLNYLDDAKISFTLMWQTYHLVWNLPILIVTIIALLALVKLVYNIILSKPITANKQSRIGWSIAFFILLVLGIMGKPVFKSGQYPLRWADAYELRDDYAANIALNPFQSFFSTLSFRKSGFEINKVKEHYAWMANYLGVDKPDSSLLTYDRSQPPTINNQPPTNVVLVICESFSAYKSSMYGNPLNTTPYFNQMCKQGVFFNRCFSPAYGTARGVWATLTGIPDVQIGTTSSRNPQAVDQHTIINDFKEHDKFYFIGGSSSWANIRGVLMNNIDGLHLYEDKDYSVPNIDVWGISDKNLFLESNKVLAKQTKPFFAVIQTADNHRPYTIPKEDLKEFTKREVPKDSLKMYGFENVEEFNAFRYTDFCFQKFIEAAKKETYFNNTLFVFVGDHGIRGDAGNMLPKVFTSQGLTNMHIPLLFYAPSFLTHAQYSKPASQVDVLPSIAHFTRTNFTNTTLGRNLFANYNNNYTFLFDEGNKTIGVISDKYYYGFQLNSNAKDELLSATDNSVVKVADSVKQQMRFATNAFYETARYMILNNKKKKQ